MTLHFKRGEFTEGLIHGIERAGALLADIFPAPRAIGMNCRTGSRSRILDRLSN